ncbi:MAG: hypothetical protein A2Y62_03910 [Candidatus Fischerbacteria bacterium RBG_13_37_8]|uniref:Uncharacterized protein n=1 Tax=Candidatus Fischerbacteria bacterium RBG_13_37_8 TaxID=1817863 RepID=A0A1F5V5I1_9BACT|nr:MAG: hypothetical protein A2Y62_03910 [Candidatus Fischerbacteria bacterium RBG_13_37_8]
MKGKTTKGKISFFLLIALSFIILCNSCSSSKDNPANTTAKKNNHVNSEITKIADAIVPEAGKIMSSWTGKSGKLLLIFEENHMSRCGQVEMALMLTRLHDLYKVNIIALEGAFSTGKNIDAKWFHNLTDSKTREDTALTLLKEGEINAAEFMAIAFPDVKVYGVKMKLNIHLI